jgi:hypothetical protein
MDSCGVTNGKSRKKPKMQGPKEAVGSGPSSAGSKDEGGRTGDRDQQKKTKDARDAAESAKNNKLTPYCLNRSTCEGQRHWVRDCPSTSKDEAAKLLATRVEKAKVGQVKMKEEKETKKARLQRVRQEEKDRVTHKLDPGRRRSAVLFFLEGFLMDAAVADTGADATVMPELVGNKLESRGLDTQRIRLENPIAFHSAKANGVETVSATKVTVKKLSMEVRGVQVVFKNATMLVGKEIDELLMGSDILNAVGFSFAEFLEKNATELDGIDLTYIKTESAMKEGTFGSLSRLAVFGGEERSDESSLLEVESAGVRRIKPVRMPILPPGTEGDPLDEEEPEIEIGSNRPEKLDMAREQLMQKAVQTGLPMGNEREMRDLAQEFADIFRIRLDDAEPAKVPNMTVNIKKEVRPTKAPPRQYNPRQKAFIETYCERLVKNKLAVKTPTSDWASPPLLVKKDPPHYFRFTLDLRGPNYATEKSDLTVPNFEQKQAELLGAKAFAKLDFPQGSWQLPLAWEAALVLAFRGVDGLYASTRMPHGAKNAAVWFQYVTSQSFRDLTDCLRQWLDDFLLLAETVRELLIALRHFFEICRSQNFKWHAVKCDLCCKEVEWCGRKISTEGIKFNPKH